MSHPRRARTVVLSSLVTAAVFAVAGCSAGDADPAATGLNASEPAEPAATAGSSPSASPTQDSDPQQAAIDERTADAIKRYMKYVEIRDSYAQKGEGASSELLPNGFLGSHAMREDEEKFGNYLATRGYRQDGSVVVEPIEFVAYDGDPLAQDFTGHEIQLTACADLTGLDYVDSDGASHFAKGERRRIQMDVTMRGDEITIEGESKPVWSVSQNSNSGEEC